MRIDVKEAMVEDAVDKISDAISMLEASDIDYALDELSDIRNYLLGYTKALQDIEKLNPSLAGEEV